MVGWLVGREGVMGEREIYCVQQREERSELWEDILLLDGGGAF
jgi:hypothetical protein